MYVGAALTHSSASFRRVVQDFKEQLRATQGALVLEWLGLSEEKIPELYERDIRNVRICDIMIAFVDEPSVGLGKEIATAIQEENRFCAYTIRAGPSRDF